MHVSRRALLGVSALIPVAALMGCSNGQQVATVTQDVVAKIDTVIAAAKNELGPLQQALGTNLPNAQDILAKVQAFIDAAGSIVVGMALNVSEGIAKQMQDDYDAVTKAITPLNLPTNIMQVWNAIGIVLPGIEIALGMFTASAVAGPSVQHAWDVVNAAAR